MLRSPRLLNQTRRASDLFPNWSVGPGTGENAVPSFASINGMRL